MAIVKGEDSTEPGGVAQVFTMDVQVDSVTRKHMPKRILLHTDPGIDDACAILDKGLNRAKQILPWF